MSKGDPNAVPPPRGGDAVPPRLEAVPPRLQAVPPRLEAVPHKVDAVPLEARPFQGQRAGIVTRTVANVVDFLVVVVALACVYAAWCAARFLINPKQFTFPAPSFIVVLMCFETVLFAYRSEEHTSELQSRPYLV